MHFIPSLPHSALSTRDRIGYTVHKKKYCRINNETNTCVLLVFIISV